MRAPLGFAALLCPAIAFAQSCPGVQQDTTYSGDDLKREKASSADECCDMCNKQSGCKYWTFHNKKQCYMKTGKGGTVKKEGDVSGSSGTAPAPPPAPTPAPPPSPTPSPQPGPSPSPVPPPPGPTPSPPAPPPSTPSPPTPPGPPAPVGRRERYLGVFQHGWTPGTHVPAEVLGFTAGVKWSTINPAEGKYDFSYFDKIVKQATSDGKSILFYVETGNWRNEGASPSWLYSHGVPKVTVEGGAGGNPWPYYLDPNYAKYFHAAHAALKQHMDQAYSAEEIKYIVGIDARFGSTGDVTPWHGTATDKKYQPSKDEWYRYWANETIILGKLYADWVNGGKDGDHDFYISVHDKSEMDMDKVYGDMGKAAPAYHFTVRNHEVCKQYQETSEKSLQSMSSEGYRFSHTRWGPKKNYIRAACTQDVGLPEGKIDHAVSQWAAVTHMLSWGQDHLDSGNHFYEEDKRMLTIFKFFNQYAGYRADEGATSTGAWVSLHDGLDSKDTKRFSESQFGKASQSNGDRMKKIAAAHKSEGAGMDDVESATEGTQLSRGRSGLNDCGWDIWPGNYEVFLRQIDPADTSVGMWRVGDFDSKKPGQFFGRFARRFDSSSGKSDMYFAVDGGVFAGHSGDVHARVVYYDKGTGGWSLQHGAGCKQETSFKKKNSNMWVEAQFTITGPFLQSCARSADLVLHHTSGDNTAFAFVELSKGPLVDLFVHP